MTGAQRRRRQGRPDGAVAAEGVLTVVNQLFADGEGITLGGKAYVFVDVLTNVDGRIKIPDTVEKFQANIVAAINLDPEGVEKGQFAAAMTANPDVKAAPPGRRRGIAVPALTIPLTALVPGAAGNALDLLTSDSSVVAVSGSGTLEDGVDDLFSISPLTPAVVVPNTQQMLAARTLFTKDVSERGGFPTWESDNENFATISQPNDADGDGQAEDIGGLLTAVAAGSPEIDALFPGFDAQSTTATITT